MTDLANPLRILSASLATVLLLAAVAACGSTAGRNAPPTADAGPDRGAALGALVTLDGGGSSDPDDDALSYAWAFTARPGGSAATLAGADSATPSFTPDVAGAYALQLTVDDGAARATDDVTVTAGPAPTADAGPDQVVAVGAVVQLDGRGSAAGGPASAPLDYAWSFLERPANSGAAVDDPTSATPRFTADEPGTYRLRLAVDDGVAPAEDTVTVRANRPPVADAGPDDGGRVGQEVVLSGGGSSDPDGDALSYAWSFVSVPGGSAATLQDAGSATARFTPDVQGSYVVDLTVGDGVAQDSDRVTLSVASAGGATTSVLYVATDGDDANPGSQAAPFATVGKALAVAASDAAIRRIEVAAGTYQEPYGQTITRDLTIVGPTDPTAFAHLRSSGSGTLLAVDGGALLTLVGVHLTTADTALAVAAGASASLADVACLADTCVSLSGTASLTGGSLTGYLPDQGTGVACSPCEGLTVSGTAVTRFATGVLASWAPGPVGIADATFRDNGTGLSVGFSDAAAVSVLRGTFDANGVGISTLGAWDVSLQGTSVTNSDGNGIQTAASGSLRLDGVTVSGSGAHGLAVDQASGGGGTTAGATVVTVRNSTLVGNVGDGAAVYGQDSTLDLGLAGEPGGNDLYSNKGASLHDARPVGGTGYVSVSATQLDVPDVPPGSYVGPLDRNGRLVIDAGTTVQVD